MPKTTRRSLKKHFSRTIGKETNQSFVCEQAKVEKESERKFVLFREIGITNYELSDILITFAIFQIVLDTNLTILW